MYIELKIESIKKIKQPADLPTSLGSLPLISHDTVEAGDPPAWHVMVTDSLGAIVVSWGGLGSQ